MTYLQKFIAISCSFLLPLVLVSYYMVEAQNVIIEREERELKGNEYQKEIRFLLEKMPEHRLLSDQFLSGKSELQEALILTQLEIGESLKRLESFDWTEEKTLRTAPDILMSRKLSQIKPKEIDLKWQSLQRELFHLTPAISNQQHRDLIKDLRDLLQYILEKSDLLHDPSIDVTVESIFTLLIEGQMWIEEAIEGLMRETHDQVEIRKMHNVMGLLDLTLTKFQKKIQQGLNVDYFTKENPDLAKDFRILIDKYITETRQFEKAFSEQVIEKSVKLDVDELKIQADKSLKSSFIILDFATDLLDTLLTQRILYLKSEQKRAFLISGIFIIVGFVFVVILIRSITVPLSFLLTAAKELKNGNLKVRVPSFSQSEVRVVGEAFNTLAESLEKLVDNLRVHTEQLSTPIKKMTDTLKNQETLLHKQKGSINKVGGAVNQVSEIQNRFMDEIERVHNRSEKMQEWVSSGKDGVQLMDTTVKQMIESSTNISYKLGIVNEKISLIFGIISKIVKVAEKTNLLSLNASIEAEKAGEYGHPFSVIAAEIQSLSEQISFTISDLEKLVHEMVSAISSGIMSVDKFSEEIRGVVALLKNIKEQLEKILREGESESHYEAIKETMRMSLSHMEKINEETGFIKKGLCDQEGLLNQSQNALLTFEEVKI